VWGEPLSESYSIEFGNLVTNPKRRATLSIIRSRMSKAEQFEVVDPERFVVFKCLIYHCRRSLLAAAHRTP
jgi:hypothetical protein